MKKFLTTACGGNIVVPNKTEKHLLAHPEVQKILAEAIGKISLPNGAFLATEVEMGRVVGLSGCVKVPWIELSDKAFFAQRIEREKPTRVLPGAEGKETTKVVILAFPDRRDKRTYVLITSWIGTLAPKEPWDANIRSKEELQESLDFWSSHALVYDHEVMGPVFESTWDEVLGK